MRTHHASAGASGSESKQQERLFTPRCCVRTRRAVKPFFFRRVLTQWRYVTLRSCCVPSLIFCGGSCRPHLPLSGAPPCPAYGAAGRRAECVRCWREITEPSLVTLRCASLHCLRRSMETHRVCTVRCALAHCTQGNDAPSAPADEEPRKSSSHYR